jgi:2,3-bisphosphoglycerate-independent phosphoglycerate mutase
VTFFFNGGIEAQYEGEDRELIASPRVATYDLKPEMSAIEVGQKVAETLAQNKYPFVMCNFAPPDMVGHVNNPSSFSSCQRYSLTTKTPDWSIRGRHQGRRSNRQGHRTHL